MKYIPYGKQDIDQDDIQAVIEVLRSDWLTQGPSIEKFENAVAEYCGTKYAVAVNSATSALHIACLSLGLGDGDILWTSPNTFVASANCALYCGADVDFVDININTYNLSVELLERKLELAKKQGRLPKVLIPVHFAGQSCDMKEIKELSNSYGFKIIEDASHAIGGSYLGKKIGCCEYSDMTVFSFHPVKIITTGEGGMILTNNESLYQKLIRLRTHGITRNSEFMTNSNNNAWYYEQVELGYNCRMTDIQAVLGYSQLKKLDKFVKKRHQIAKRYNNALQDLPLILPYQNPTSCSSFHLYPIRLDLSKIRKNRDQVFEELRDAGIGVNVHYIPVHTQPYYRNRGFKWGNFPEAERYFREAISIPMYSDLKDEEQDYVISKLLEVLT